MNKVIQLLESTKQKQEEALKQLPKMVDEHVATVAVEGEQFIKEIDQALLVLSNVVGQSEQFGDVSENEEMPNNYKPDWNGNCWNQI